jgi:hypothetical protein
MLLIGRSIIISPFVPSTRFTIGFPIFPQRSEREHPNAVDAIRVVLLGSISCRSKIVRPMPVSAILPVNRRILGLMSVFPSAMYSKLPYRFILNMKKKLILTAFEKFLITYIQ